MLYGIGTYEEANTRGFFSFFEVGELNELFIKYYISLVIYWKSGLVLFNYIMFIGINKKVFGWPFKFLLVCHGNIIFQG